MIVVSLALALRFRTFGRVGRASLVLAVIYPKQVP